MPIRPESTQPRLEALEQRLLMSSGPLITEFMAANDSTLADIDGEFPDWIEIHNPTAATISLDGWYLTDDLAEPTAWRMPDPTGGVDVPIGPGGYLIVFASGKDRSVAGAELHTNFKLNSDGEDLALVAPDGVTFATVYDAYPAMPPDASYGLAPTAAATLVGSPAAAAAIVPTDGELDDAWKQVGFDDSSWPAGETAVGYENGSGYEPLLDISFRDEMYGIATTAYVRIPFTVSDPTAFSVLTLRMKYDDGFAAFLNGVLVAAANAPTTLAWDGSDPASSKPLWRTAPTSKRASQLTSPADSVFTCSKFLV